MAAILYHHSENPLVRRSLPEGSAIEPFAGTSATEARATSWWKPWRWMPCSFQSTRRAAIPVGGTATEEQVGTGDGMVVSADVMLRGEHGS